MNVLIAILSSNVDREKFNEIVAEFDKSGYNVHILDNAEEQAETMINLPLIVDYIEKAEGKPIDRFVVLSNIREYIFSWYRCYNALADDFIYYFDKNSEFDNVAVVGAMPHGDFYEKIYNFHGIEQEKNQGKLYINLELANIKELNKFLLMNNRFSYFDFYSNFIFDSNIKKDITNKCYVYKNLEYSFSVSEDTDTQKIVIDIEKLREEIDINNEFYRKIEENFYFLFYFFIVFYENFECDPKQRDSILLAISQNIELSDEAKEYLYRNFTVYCKQSTSSFVSKLYFVSLIVKLGIKENMYETIMNLLLNDDENMIYHYPMLINSLFYETHGGIANYKNIFKDRETELSRIAQYYRGFITGYSAGKRKAKKIAIHVSQLLSLLHSPTLLTLNYAKYLKKYYPGYEIAIFVDDTFIYDATEVVFPHVYSSVLSSNCKEIHDQFLKNTDITIYYPSYHKGRLKKICKDLKKIHKFAPEVILSFGTCTSITRQLLYDNYPILDISLGGLSNSQHADIFIHGYEEVYFEQECIKYDFNIENLQKGKILKHKGGVDFLEPIRSIKREDYNVFIEDFVMITVGNRLDAEMSDSFIDMVCSFLQERSNVKWFIVGNAELIYLKSNYSKLVDKQIIFITYENDLAALYRICDIYINPFRLNGGYSAGMAMNQNLPIVTLSTSDDVIAFVSKKNSVANIEEYFSEMQRLYEDIDYKKSKGILMKKCLEENFSFKAAIEDIVNASAKAINEFSKRIL